METLSAFVSHGLVEATFWQLAAYTLLTTHVTIVAVTIYLHRAQAHRALTLHPIASHFFRFWLWLTTGMVTREWVAIHRMHHAGCETARDPHSPVVLGVRTVLWRGTELYRLAARDEPAIARYGHGTPEDWIERRLYSKYSWQGVAVLLIMDFLMFGAAGATVWAIQMLWIPFLAAGVVNGIGHFWGYRNFDCVGAATNIGPIGILIGGEELHNNHHTFATAAKLSVKWYEFDVGWLYIRLLQMLGLARVHRLPRFPRRRRTPALDLTTLQAVLANRPVIMARLSSTLGEVWRAELRRMMTNDAAGRNTAMRLLRRDPSLLSPAQHDSLLAIVQRSTTLRELQQLRQDLTQLWRRDHDTPEQLLGRLTAWCRHADTSSCAGMRRFSASLRLYS